MAASSFAELIRPMINTACTLGISYVKHCPSTSDRFVVPKSLTIKFGFWIVTLLAIGCYSLIRTKQDVLERSQKESYFDYVLFFVSNMMLVLTVLQMVYYGYTRKHVQLELLNSTIDIERELTVLLKRKINYGVIARFTKWLTIWTIFFYVIIMHTLYVFDHLRYNTFILMYIETLLLLYANNCIEFTIIICCTTQMTLCRYLKDLMNALETKKLPLASELYMYFKLIDRITVLINFHLSQIYGSFVVFHCMYVLFESASIWFSFLSASSSMQFQIVNEESNLMLVSYILWFLSDSKNVLLVAISSSLLQQKVEETALCTRHFDDYRLQNTRAAKQIQNFLLKNLHQKKKFSACGFFDIDNTVIYMVFSSIVTYLVILIQFKQLETDLTQAGDGYNVTSNVSTVQP
ncbi:AGAP009805-PB [Anopheles gambiae str. PEST]|uniref:Gustatory receptor n=1 Tax=Anopheles gambiae TaxID=7165 RepID=A7UV33_ANOGA|nr:AGAP009805-PB [Anopheles gambiae str. PEST]